MEIINKQSFTLKTSTELSAQSEQQALALVDLVKQARQAVPKELEALKESEVPEFEGMSAQGCLKCSYTKTVNKVVDDMWDHPYVEPSPVTSQGVAIGACGDCGVHVESYTIVVDHKTSKDVIEMWELAYRAR